MRVLICGGRDFTDYRRFAAAMHEIELEHGPFSVIMHGGAKGADHCAHLWANSPIGAKSEVIFEADWATYGKAAGPKRNQRMIDEGKPDLVVAFPGGRGTADMVRCARIAKLAVVEALHVKTG